MVSVRQEHVVAIRIGSEIVCVDCFTSEELDEVEKPEDLFTEPVDGDYDYLTFCDRCRTRIR